MGGVFAVTGAILLNKFQKEMENKPAPPQPPKAPETTPKGE